MLPRCLTVFSVRSFSRSTRWAASRLSPARNRSNFLAARHSSPGVIVSAVLARLSAAGLLAQTGPVDLTSSFRIDRHERHAIALKQSRSSATLCPTGVSRLWLEVNSHCAESFRPNPISVPPIAWDNATPFHAMATVLIIRRDQPPCRPDATNTRGDTAELPQSMAWGIKRPLHSRTCRRLRLLPLCFIAQVPRLPSRFRFRLGLRMLLVFLVILARGLTSSGAIAGGHVSGRSLLRRRAAACSLRLSRASGSRIGQHGLRPGSDRYCRVQGEGLAVAEVRDQHADGVDAGIGIVFEPVTVKVPSASGVKVANEALPSPQSIRAL